MQFIDDLIDKYNGWRIERGMREHPNYSPEVRQIWWDALSGDMKLTFCSPEFEALMFFAGKMFETFGVDNYLSFLLASRHGPLEFVIQKPDGLTPAQKNIKLEMQLSAVRAQLRQHQVDEVERLAKVESDFNTAVERLCATNVWKETDEDTIRRDADKLYTLMKQTLADSTPEIWEELIRMTNVR